MYDGEPCVTEAISLVTDPELIAKLNAAWAASPECQRLHEEWAQSPEELERAAVDLYRGWSLHEDRIFHAEISDAWDYVGCAPDRDAAVKFVQVYEGFEFVSVCGREWPGETANRYVFCLGAYAATDEKSQRLLVRIADDTITEAECTELYFRAQSAAATSSQIHIDRFRVSDLESVMPNKPNTKPSTAADYPYVSRCMADVKEEPIHWLWYDRIPLGKFGLIAGYAKQGKSQITCALTAAVTTGGLFPDGTRAQKGSVILITCEDDAGDTIKPRLRAAGADLTKVHLYDGTVVQGKNGARQTAGFVIGEHIPALEALAEKIGDVAMVVIDPVAAYMGRADSHIVAEVRAALAPTQVFAAKHKIAVVGITHLNKSKNTNSLLDRISGSGGFVAVARWVWLVGEDNNDETRERRFMCPIGANVCKSKTGFAYRITDVDLGGGIRTSKVSFESHPMDIDPAGLLEARAPADNPGALEEAVEFLRAELSDGPRASKEIDREAKAAGIASKTLQRAREKLRLHRCKIGSVWWMSLPNAGRNPAHEFEPIAAAGH